jgi:hypothetical protein
MKITLQRGDYANRTKMGEAKYLECAQKFLAAGCPPMEAIGCYYGLEYFGWPYAADASDASDASGEGFFHSKFKSIFYGRELTYEQIMGIDSATEGDLKKQLDQALEKVSQLERMLRIQNQLMLANEQDLSNRIDEIIGLLGRNINDVAVN